MFSIDKDIAGTRIVQAQAHDEMAAQFATNRVKNTKYTLLTFLPKNLYEQFG